MRRERSWSEANQEALLGDLAQVRLLLERAAGRETEQPPPAPATTPAIEPSHTAIDALCAAFGLSRFERQLLLLCAGMELDGAFPTLCAAAQGDPGRPHATFSLALAALPDAHWSALTPAAPLRLWQLVEVLPGDTLVTSPLRIDERILHYLTGVSYLDDRLQHVVRPVEPPVPLTPTQQSLAERMAASWAEARGRHDPPLVQICGPDPAAGQAIAASACEMLGAPLFVARARDLPAPPGERELLRRLWQREAVLGGCALLVDCYDGDAEALRAATALVEGVRGPLAVVGREPLRFRAASGLRLDVPRPSAPEQAALWHDTLGELAAELNGQLETVVEHFAMGAESIQAAGMQARAELAASGGSATAGRVLWDACRAQARPRLDDLAQRIEPAASWDELVLPLGQKEILRQIADNVGQRSTVYGRWGLGGRGRRGLGISALFAGASGTGKTMAAEVLAGEMRLDLYRIDLSQVVSKYIGETEKNLARVFDAAEAGGAVLLFDEADALFGKRSEVKDSHDRYANIEVSYLLQRMEAYRGLAILTTNMKSALDSAFLRRIRFVVQFPFPDAAHRAEIWRAVFPPATPTEGLDVEKLARLNVAGGNIRNVALNAAFIAAGAGQPVRMEHLLRAARAEYAKLEKPLTDAEVAGWR